MILLLAWISSIICVLLVLLSFASPFDSNNSPASCHEFDLVVLRIISPSMILRSKRKSTRVFAMWLAVILGLAGDNLEAKQREMKLLRASLAERETSSHFGQSVGVLDNNNDNGITTKTRSTILCFFPPIIISVVVRVV